MRLVQGVGGAFLFANSQAILTDAFPPEQRGLAFGINGIAFLAGQFVGLVVGGILAAINWRLVFFVSVPVGWPARSGRICASRSSVRSRTRRSTGPVT